MLSFEEALNLVRERFSKYYIAKGFRYEEMNVFSLVSKEYEKICTGPIGITVGVTDSGDIYRINHLIESEEEFINAEKSAIKIDDIDMDEVHRAVMTNFYSSFASPDEVKAIVDEAMKRRKSA